MAGVLRFEENCIFCRIIAGKIPSAKVYEDKDVLAFLDISPVNKGHTLVVPKNHSEDITHDDEKSLFACIAAARKIGKAMLKVGSEGFNIGINTGQAAGQAVFHTHLHVIPRHQGDGLRHWLGGNYQEGEMEEYRKKIFKNI